ncbi:hypothetical protein EVA_04219 [gut metagenome]|uniref:Uncharacterized protein n=1 Tax=gut metagenome TaxID=749906 RepID=J9D4R3_9ZZZZ
MIFDGLCDGSRHGLGVCAFIDGRNTNGWRCNIRILRKGKNTKCNEPCQHDQNGEYGCKNRTADTELTEHDRGL